MWREAGGAARAQRVWLEGDPCKVITLPGYDPLGCVIYRHGAGCHGCRIGANCHSTGLLRTLSEHACACVCVCVVCSFLLSLFFHCVLTSFCPHAPVCLPVCVCVCVSRHRYDCVRVCTCGAAAALRRFHIRRCFTAAALVLFILFSPLTRISLLFSDQLCKVAHRISIVFFFPFSLPTRTDF